MRARILAAASELIAKGGGGAATTRAVAHAASVQAPTIYRLFGDKRGLLDAVAEHCFSRYVASKARREPHPDPVQDLRDGWDAHVAFGLANPAIAVLISGAADAERPSPATIAGLAVLRERIRRVARTGRLRVDEERAVVLIHAMGTGAVLTLLGMAPEDRGGLADAAREAVLAAVLDERITPPSTGVAGMASALKADLDDVPALTPGERHILGELLDRIAGAPKPSR